MTHKSFLLETKLLENEKQQTRVSLLLELVVIYKNYKIIYPFTNNGTIILFLKQKVLKLLLSLFRKLYAELLSTPFQNLFYFWLSG